MNLIVIDSTLKNYNGHSYEYMNAALNLLKENHKKLVIFCDANYDFKKFNINCEIYPYLNFLSRFFEIKKFYKKKIINNKKFNFFLKPLYLLKIIEIIIILIHVKKKYRNYTVFIQSPRYFDLIALSIVKFNHSKIKLVIRCKPQLYNGFDGEKKFINCLNRIKLANNVDFYCDTMELLNYYRISTNILFQYLPIPLYKKPGFTRKLENEVTIGILGPPRFEKGFDRVNDLISNIDPKIVGKRIRFIIQSDYLNEFSEFNEINKFIANSSKSLDKKKYIIEMVEIGLDSHEYKNLLCRVHILILPYKSEKYLFSSSGIFCDGLSNSIPMIVTPQTRMSNIIRNAKITGYLIGEELLFNTINLTIKKITENYDNYVDNLEKYNNQFKQENKLFIENFLNDGLRNENTDYG